MYNYSITLKAHTCTYVCTFVHTYVRMYIHVHVCTYALFLCMYVNTTLQYKARPCTKATLLTYFNITVVSALRPLHEKGVK